MVVGLFLLSVEMRWFSYRLRSMREERWSKHGRKIFTLFSYNRGSSSRLQNSEI